MFAAPREKMVTMKTFVWFVLGIAGGFVVAHLVNKDPRGHEMLSQVDARIGEFTDRMGDAYRDQEAQFVDLVAEAKTAASDAVAAAGNVAADAAEAAKNATAKLTD
ncbi:hypothetical protein GCM10009758_08540 [Microbacterium hatanonis]